MTRDRVQQVGDRVEPGPALDRSKIHRGQLPAPQRLRLQEQEATFVCRSRDLHRFLAPPARGARPGPDRTGRPCRVRGVLPSSLRWPVSRSSRGRALRHRVRAVRHDPPERFWAFDEDGRRLGGGENRDHVTDLEAVEAVLGTSGRLLRGRLRGQCGTLRTDRPDAPAPSTRPRGEPEPYHRPERMPGRPGVPQPSVGSSLSTATPCRVGVSTLTRTFRRQTSTG